MRPTPTAGKGLKSESEIKSPAVEAPHRRIGSKLAIAFAGVVLGLALSRGLTEAMGGMLEPHETPGGGLTMVISLPAARRMARGAASESSAGCTARW